MTISHDEGIWWVECDDCGDCHDLGAESFQEAVAEVRSSGWQPVLVQDEWEHYCPDCQKKEIGDAEAYER